jgi:hypothetical protein
MTVSVSAGEHLTGIQVLLSPTGVISGRVVDERGKPQRSILVVALRREYRNGIPTMTTIAGRSTNDQGEYRIFDLTPGEYYVQVRQQSVAPIYYPGFADPDSAAVVNIDSGREAGAIDFTLRRTQE